MKFKFISLLIVLPSLVFCQDKKDVLSWIGNIKQLMSSDPVTMAIYLDSVKHYVKANPTEKYISAEYLKLLGIQYYRKSAYDSSIFYYSQARTIYQSLDSLLDIAKISVNLSMCYTRLSNYRQSIHLASDALRSFEKLGDIKGIGISNNMIGQVYFLNNEYEKSLEFFKTYLRNTSDSLERAGGLNNIGSALSGLKKYDSALWYHEQALEIHLKLKSPYGIGNAYQNIASLLSEVGRSDESLTFYKKAMPYYKDAHNEAGVLETTLNTGIEYNKLSKYGISIGYLTQAVALASKLGERYMEQKALLALSSAYENTGDIKNALSMYKNYKTVSDSIYNKDTRGDIEKISVQYETEKKNQQIALLNQQNELKTATIENNYLIIGGLLLALSFFSLLFYIWRYRNRQMQQAVAREQKIHMRELQIKAVIDSQENERKRFASDLHDGMGQLVAALQLNIHSIKQQTELENRVELVENSELLLSDIQGEIRNIAFNLMPPVLVKEGLVAAVKELIRRVNKTSSLKAEFNEHGISERFDSQVEISIYRVIQELLANIIKHSQASVLSISFTGHDTEAIITIEDNGNGFDVNQFKQSNPGNGWHTVETRINLIKGQIDFDTMPGRKNNTVIIQIPIASVNAGAEQLVYQNT